MSAVAAQGWRGVREEVLRRIQTREWGPGDLIPNEADLAYEFGCARATVNRALRSLSDAGLLDRRRRAGTRVATHPVRKATLSIPVLRLEIEGRGQAYGCMLLRRAEAAPPAEVRARLGPGTGARLLHVEAVHLADGRPHAAEDRWIDPAGAPGIGEVDLSRISANEWLVLNAPFTRGDIAFSAAAATGAEAETLGVAAGAPLFVVERRTWRGETPVTWVRLAFPPGYRMRTEI